MKKGSAAFLYQHFLYLAILLVISLGSACSNVRFISDYDEETDSALTSIQRKVDDFIEKLVDESGSEAASYENNQSFYVEIDRDLRQLEFRVASIPDNQHTTELVSDIRNVILSASEEAGDRSLQDLHRIQRDPDLGLNPVVLEVARRSINQAISAALRLELAKKRGME